MTLLRIFTNNPFAGITFLICCATVLLAIRMVKQARWKEDRFIVGFLGLLSLHQCLMILRDAGVVPPGWRSAEQVASAVIAALFLTALILLRTQLWQLRNAQMRLRISEMNMAPQTWVEEEVMAIKERYVAPPRRTVSAACQSPTPPPPVPTHQASAGVSTSPPARVCAKGGTQQAPGLWAFTKTSVRPVPLSWSAIGRRLKAPFNRYRLFR